MISTEELYAGTQFCRNEFYQGDLKEFRSKDPLFAQKILPYFQQIVNTDILSNAYFGDVSRVAGPTAAWSTDKFDGVFKWIKTYIDSGAIPAAQTIAIADGTDYYAGGGPAAAYALLKSMYEKQPILMTAIPDSEKAFHVTKQIASAYEDYLIATGATGGNLYVVEGIKTLKYKGIDIVVQETWYPIITEIKGSAGHAAVLTVKGNFVFATDKTYGEGEDGHTALEVWYEKKEMQWYYRFFLKAGTQIALPEFIVIALSSWT
jgi:hypothetical protein